MQKFFAAIFIGLTMNFLSAPSFGQISVVEAKKKAVSKDALSEVKNTGITVSGSSIIVADNALKWKNVFSPSLVTYYKHFLGLCFCLYF